MLHTYQKECLDTIVDTFGLHDEQLIQLPTGGGKTFIFLHYLLAHSKKALIICPSLDLINQVQESAKFLYLKNKCSFDVITTHSLTHEKRRNEIYSKGYDTIIIDEAHHAQSMTYHRFLGGIPYKFKLLGLTATPERADGLDILQIFKRLSYSKRLVDLINLGFLCDIEAYKIHTKCKVNTHNMRKGDFILSELKRLDTASRNELIYKTYDENCRGKKTLIFCLSIQHAEDIANHMKKQGIKAIAVHGYLNKTERKQILKGFKDGLYDVVTNCQLLTEGFDEPSIECLIIARPTASKSLYAQMVGRGVRNHPGKDICKLYELTDNCFNICTFDILTGKNFQGYYDYPQGVSLTRMERETEELTLQEFVLEKQKMDILGSDLSSTIFNKREALDIQKQRLAHMGIQYMQPLTIQEAAYLMWKHKKLEEYGIH